MTRERFFLWFVGWPARATPSILKPDRVDNAMGNSNGQRGFETVGKFLEQDGWHAAVDDDLDTTYVMNYRGDNLTFGCQARVRTDLEQLICYAIVPRDVPPSRRAAMQEFIARANYGLRLGNLELDLETGDMRAKSSIDFEASELTAQLIKNTLYPSVQTLDYYWPGIEAVLEGTPPAEAVAAAEGKTTLAQGPTEYDGVALDSRARVREVVFKQLANGLHRDKFDSRPADWLGRATKEVGPTAKAWLADALAQALACNDETVRAEAVRWLDGSGDLVAPQARRALVTDHFELFRGLRRPEDQDDYDAGLEMVRLACAALDTPDARAFARMWARDRDYGTPAVGAMARQDTGWLVDHAETLFGDALDPQGRRLGILVFRLRRDRARLTALAAKLRASDGTSARLEAALREHITDEQLLAELLEPGRA